MGKLGIRITSEMDKQPLGPRSSLSLPRIILTKLQGSNCV